MNCTVSAPGDESPLTSTSDTRVVNIPAQNQNKEDGTKHQTAVSQASASTPSISQEKPSDLVDNHKKVLSDFVKEKPHSVHASDSHMESGSSVEVSDNREASLQTDLPPDPQDLPAKDSPIMAMLANELKAIRARLDTVYKIETTTSSLAELLKNITDRTSKLEEVVQSNVTLIQEIKTDATSTKAEINANSINLNKVNAEVATLKETVELQGRAIVKLTTLKADLLKQNKEVKAQLYKQNQAVKADLIQQNEGIKGEMSKLIDQQKEKVDSFHATTKTVERNIMEKAEEKIEERVGTISHNISFQKLKDQAYANRFNVLITGLEEVPEKSIKTTVSDLFRKMGEENMIIADAYRLGTATNDSSYHRPVKVRFSQLPDRNKIWRKRMNVPAEDGTRKVRIQADLPKDLRDETSILYRIIRAAAKSEKHKSAVIRSYAIQLQGKEYSPWDLESLPKPIRPSTISNPRSKEAIVFFSKYSVL